MSETPTGRRTSVVVVGGGPGGYEAALVGAQLGADVTVVESDGLGGAAVLTDCVPSKTLIATSELLTEVEDAATMGVSYASSNGHPSGAVGRLGPGEAAGPGDQPGPGARPRPEAHAVVDVATVNARVKALAAAQSCDIRTNLEAAGVRVLRGRAWLADRRVEVDGPDGRHSLDSDAALLAVGATPRRLPDAMPDGDRILDWRQLYELAVLPERLVVVGSGVTGAEFASAYLALGSDVVLVSSRDRVLPGEDADAAEVLEGAFRRRGMTVLARSRASSVRREGDEVVVSLEDGRRVSGSHCLVAVGSVPSTAGIGLEDVGVQLSPGGHVVVDRVSRTSVRGLYAAGDCTGVMPLASVAAMQGRIAMRHLLGDEVRPLALKTVASNIFTAPEIATVGLTQAQVDAGTKPADQVLLPLARNPRAKMQGLAEGFVKLFASKGSGAVLGGVIVAPRASELVFPVTLAVQHRLSVDDVARAFTVYPSLSGSIAEAARRLHVDHSLT